MKRNRTKKVKSTKNVNQISTFQTIKRLLKYLTSTYKLQFFIVLVCIIISSIVGVIGIQFLEYLIDGYNSSVNEF